MKTVYSTLAEIPEAFRTEYEQRDGQFHLKVEGDYAPLVEANRKLAEFRDNNRALNAQISEVNTKLKSFEGIDPTEVVTMRTELDGFKKKGAAKPDDLTAMLSAELKKATEPLIAQLTEIKAREESTRRSLEVKGLEDALREAGTKAGVRDTAMKDFIRRGTEVYKVVDGKYVAMNGETPLFSKKSPADPLPFAEWAETLKPEAGHLFEPSKGAGTPPGTPGGPAAGPKRFISSDPIVFGQNLEAIAKGEVGVLAE